MSKRKCKQRASKNQQNDFWKRVNEFHLKFTALLSALISVLIVIPCSHVVNIIMMIGKRERTSENFSDKKRARLLNKQNKVRAEYSLIVKKGLPQTSESSPTEEQGKLDDEQFKALKKELAERKRQLVQLPRFWYNSTVGASASVYATAYGTRTPLLLSDIEHLITYAYGGNALVPPPSRWCSLQKPNRLNGIVVLVVSGVGLCEFVDNEEHLSSTMEVFGEAGSEDNCNRAIVEFLSPSWYGCSLNSEVMDWAVIRGVKTDKPVEIEKKEAETPAGTEIPQGPDFQSVVNQLSSVFPIKGEVKTLELPEGDTFSRTELILTLPQLIQEHYPMPIPSNALSKINFEPTASSYKPVNAQSKMFSIDCEMCSTEDDPQALTKVAVIDEHLNVIYETLVKPDTRIVDYLTKWSGITKAMLENVEVKLSDVQEHIKTIVKEHPDCIFVGQSLNCDLKALRMTHPYVIDTSVIFNLSGIEGKKSSLKNLSYYLLNQKIQIESNKKSQPEGHCPIEDASAALKLVKRKLETGFSFGNALKNPNYLRQSTKLAIDPFFNNNSFKQNKLDKNVLLAYQKDDECLNDKREPASQPTDNAPKATRKVQNHHTTSNKATVAHVSTSIYEYFLSIGFYNINPASENYSKALQKLDKRVKKLYHNLGGNTLFVVLCSKRTDCLANGTSMFSDTTRRNNGVALIKLKVSEIPKRSE